MSTYPKFLWPITIDSSNQTFGWDETGVGAKGEDIPAADYDTILEVLAALTTVMDAEGGVAFTMAVSSVGQVTITGDAAWTWVEGTTDDTLEVLLGLDSADAVAADVLTPTDYHTHGWYPGVTSFGASSGAAHTSESDWTPAWPRAQSISGSGKMRRIAPSRPPWARAIGWDLLTDDEVLDPDRGVHALAIGAFATALRFYPDRDTGTVATPGTQGDPQDDPRDSETDFWKVYIDPDVEWQLHGQSGSYRSVSLGLHGEPD